MGRYRDRRTDDEARQDRENAVNQWQSELPAGDDPITIVHAVTTVEAIWRDIHKQVVVLRSKQIMDRERLKDIETGLTSLQTSLDSLHSKIDRLLDDHRLT